MSPGIIMESHANTNTSKKKQCNLLKEKKQIMLVVHYRGSICVLLWYQPLLYDQYNWYDWLVLVVLELIFLQLKCMFPKKVLFICTVCPATSGLCFTVNSGQIRGTISEKFTLLKQGQCALYPFWTLIPNIQFFMQHDLSFSFKWQLL